MDEITSDGTDADNRRLSLIEHQDQSITAMDFQKEEELRQSEKLGSKKNTLSSMKQVQEEQEGGDDQQQETSGGSHQKKKQHQQQQLNQQPAWHETSKTFEGDCGFFPGESSFSFGEEEVKEDDGGNRFATTPDNTDNDGNMKKAGLVGGIRMKSMKKLISSRKLKEEDKFEDDNIEPTIFPPSNNVDSDNSNNSTRNENNGLILDADTTEDNSNNNNNSSRRNTSSGYKKMFHKFRLLSGQIVNNNTTQTLIIALIIINAIMMGIATFDFVTNDPQVDHTFEIIDLVFLIIFTIELAMQITYHGLYLFTDGWLVFDFVIVLVSWAFSGLQIIRAFRIFRALRLVTRVQVLKNLVIALFAVMPRMTAITALLLLVFYIFGVMCTYLFRDLYTDGLTDDDYFSRLDVSFFTLFQIMTLEDWGAIARQIMEVYSWSWIIFISYVMITSFIVFNLVIAVVCDAVAVIERNADKEEMNDSGNAENLDVSDIQNNTNHGSLNYEQHQAALAAVNIQRIANLKDKLSNLSTQQEDIMGKLKNTFEKLNIQVPEVPVVPPVAEVKLRKRPSFLRNNSRRKDNNAKKNKNDSSYVEGTDIGRLDQIIKANDDDSSFHI